MKPRIRLASMQQRKNDASKLKVMSRYLLFLGSGNHRNPSEEFFRLLIIYLYMHKTKRRHIFVH